jgi:lipopolysaccharide biosynthesis protein
MKLALYAHYSKDKDVARHVLFFLRKLRELDFQTYFISNSPVSLSGREQLHECCARVIQRENAGFDFAMWQKGLAECDLSQVEELLLTNSSIVGPLQPLAALWQDPALKEYDFWGLTDNDEIWPHLQSFFLVFHSRVIRSNFFLQFWKSILPYQDKYQVIRSYEVGLTNWLEQNGFKWKALFPQRAVLDHYIAARKGRNLFKKVLDRLKNQGRPAQWQGGNTTLFYPDVLIASGMPFLKASLLTNADNGRINPALAFKLLESSNLPKDALEELHQFSRKENP